MLIIGSREEEKNYRDNPGLNQSTLKNLEYGLNSFLTQQEENKKEKSYFHIGSAVDCLLTAPEGTFEKEYYVSRLSSLPSVAIITILQSIFNKLKSFGEVTGKLEDYTEVVKEVIIEAKYQENWKLETRVSKIIDNEINKEYFEDLKKSYNKTLLSMEEESRIFETVQSLKDNVLTKKFFDRDSLSKSEDIIMLYQKPIYFKYIGLNCKALPDMVILTIDENHVIKTIEIVDLKTTAKRTEDFFISIMSFRYDIQAAFYNIAVLSKENIEYFNKIGLTVNDDTIFIAPFSFVVESTTEPGNPLIYVTKDSLLDQGMFGTEDVFIDGQLIKRGKKGISQLIKEYKYYQDTEFKEDIKLRDRNGIIPIDENGIVIKEIREPEW